MSIETITRKDSCRFRAVVRFGGRKVSKTFVRKVDANQWQCEMKAGNRTSFCVSSIVNRRLTLDDLFRRFEREYSEIRNAPSTRIQNRSLYSKYLGHFGMRKVHSLGSADFEAYFLYLLNERAASNGRINRVRTLLHTLFQRAVGWNILQTNPIARIAKLPTADPFSVDKIRFLAKSEVRVLLQWLRDNDPWLYPKVFILLQTGIRYSEMAALKVDDLQLDGSSYLKVGRSRCRHTGRMGLPKSKRARIVPLSDESSSYLKTIVATKGPDDPVAWVTWQEGRWPTKVTDRFALAIRQAQVSTISIHALRHTFAVRFLENGGHIFDLKEILGHQDVKVTMRYSHFSPAMTERARASVNFDWAASDVPQKSHAVPLFGEKSHVELGTIPS